MMAPPAPSAAAGVGFVIPPRIEPKTATIKSNGGNTTRINSTSAKRVTAIRTPYKIIKVGTDNSINVPPAVVNGVMRNISIKTASKTPVKPNAIGRNSS